VLKLLRLKQRPQHKGLILIAANYQQLTRYILPLSDNQQQQLRLSGRQAITYLMPARKNAPRWLRGASDFLAVRLTGHAQAARLCAAVDLALVSTSANLSGMRPVKTYAECQRRFGTKVRVLPGIIGKRKRPSTIKVWGNETTIRY
jgi:L-threonylcarbamoyladenylate synthase